MSVKATATKPLGSAKNLFSSPTRQVESVVRFNSPLNQVMNLHQTLGNREVQRLFKAGKLQAALKIGQPNDIYEQEADRMADRVMRMEAPQAPEIRRQSYGGAIQRMCNPCSQEYATAAREKRTVRRANLCPKCASEENLKIQRKPESTISSDSAVPDNFVTSLGVGQPLDKATRDYFEPRFGIDFSHIRVHTGPQAAESAGSINALAYTLGHNVVFGAGQYQPNTLQGKRLLAHEMTHVVQQADANGSRAGTDVLQASSNNSSETPIPERSSATIRLLTLVDQLEKGLQQATRMEPSDATLSSHRSDALQQIPGLIAQFRTAANSNDEVLKQRILAGFTPRYLEEATTQAAQKISTVTIRERSQGFAAMPRGISRPHDAAEREAVRVSEAIISGGSASIIAPAHPGIIHRDGGASAALAALTTFELAGGGEAEAATGPPGWVVGGVVLLAMAGLAIYVATTSTTRACPPCPTPPGPDVDRVPPSAPHFPCPGDHWHYYQYNQNPTTCQCFGPRRMFGGCCGLPGAPC